MSAPTEGLFSHVGHMGYDSENSFVSSGVDPSWNTFLTDLESHGIDQQLINQKMDFIKDFVRDAKKGCCSHSCAFSFSTKKEETISARASAQCFRTQASGFHLERGWVGCAPYTRPVISPCASTFPIGASPCSTCASSASCLILTSPPPPSNRAPPPSQPARVVKNSIPEERREEEKKFESDEGNEKEGEGGRSETKEGQSVRVTVDTDDL